MCRWCFGIRCWINGHRHTITLLFEHVQLKLQSNYMIERGLGGNQDLTAYFTSPRHISFFYLFIYYMYWFQRNHERLDSNLYISVWNCTGAKCYDRQYVSNHRESHNDLISWLRSVSWNLLHAITLLGNDDDWYRIKAMRENSLAYINIHMHRFVEIFFKLKYKLKNLVCLCILCCW